MQKLCEIEEHAGTEGLSPFRVLVRPIAYCFGLFLSSYSSTSTDAQFIYSQF